MITYKLITDANTAEDWRKGTLAISDTSPQESLESSSEMIGTVRLFKSTCNNEEECDTLAILNLPTYMTTTDLFEMIQPQRDLLHIRIIKEESRDTYMVMITFETPAKARRWKGQWKEPWQVIFISPFDDQGVELPTCPVCLDRLDSSITGLLTTPCSHTFHSTCLREWNHVHSKEKLAFGTENPTSYSFVDSPCPVCRYSTVFKPEGNDQVCLTVDCKEKENLWICLVCGNLGCGRYSKAHAQSHYKETHHLYAMELQTGRVWDYAGDGYVHRLVQIATGLEEEGEDEARSKGWMEIPGLDTLPSGSEQGSVMVPREKLDAMGLEYSHLLSSQLEAQRAYFERKQAEVVHGFNQRIKLLEETVIKKEKDGKKDVQQALTTQLRRALADLQTERILSSSLVDKLKAVELREKERDLELKELQETVHDLMMSIETGKMVQNSTELQGGSLGLLEPQKKKGKGRK
jgi:BRCA1-associated protein